MTAVVGITLILFALEWRGERLQIGPLQFYWTTARLALIGLCLYTVLPFLKRGLSILWSRYRFIFISGIALCAWALISGILNRLSGSSIEQLVYFGCFFYLFFALLALSEDRSIAAIPRLLWISALLLSVLACLEFLIPSLKIFLSETFRPMAPGAFMDRSMATLQNPTVLGLSIVFGLMALWFKEDSLKPGLKTLFSILMVVAAFLCGSRMSIGFVTLFMAWRLVFARKRRISVTAPAIMLLAIILFWHSHAEEPSVLVSKPSPTFWERTSAIEPVRFMIWATGLRIWQDHPWIGVGPGMSRQYYFWPPYFREGIYGDIVHTHNLILRVLCELGLIGLIFFCVFAYSILKEIFPLNAESSWMLAAFVVFESLEEFTRDIYPTFVFVLLFVYLVRVAQIRGRRA